jgi:hypothetical protein
VLLLVLVAIAAAAADAVAVAASSVRTCMLAAAAALTSWLTAGCCTGSQTSSHLLLRQACRQPLFLRPLHLPFPAALFDAWVVLSL